MRWWLVVLATLGILTPSRAHAQNDPGLDPADRLVRYRYANDVFNRTDYYYTQGMRLEWRTPVLAHSPLARVLLPASVPGQRFHSLVVNHAGYTPTGTAQDDIRYGDRPFAATLFAGERLIVEDHARGTRMTAQLDAGVIGPLAGGKQTQTEIHRSLGQRLPRGWNNQIHNDVILNYSYEVRATIASTPWGDAQSVTRLRLGTLYTDLGTGASVRVGRLGSGSRSLRAYGFLSADARGVGYNATLQGGVFNPDSPYTIAPSPIVLRGVAGAACHWRGFGAVLSNTWITREFDTGRPHQWLQASLTGRF